MLDEVAAMPGVKGIMLTFDDFLKGMDDFGQQIQPLMACRARTDAERGLTRRAGPVARNDTARASGAGGGGAPWRPDWQGRLMPDTDPALMSAETLLGLYARRALSPVEALKAVMERVARYNPWVNAFAAMNPRALQRGGRERGALDGGPPDRPAGWRAGHGEGPADLAGFPTRRGSRTTDADARRPRTRPR